MTYTLITGASGGIGYELALEFARTGHNLILVARSEEKLRTIRSRLEEQFSIQVEVIPADLTREEEVDRLWQEVCTRGLTVENLVNNAGVGDAAPYLDRDWQVHGNMVALNVTALMKLCHLCGSQMREARRGRIMNVSSLAAFCAGPYMSVYYATKAFVLSFSQALSEELRPFGVSVTALCPGPTYSGFEKAANMETIRMFSLIPPATSEAVARRGFKAMMKGKAVVFHGAPVYMLNLGIRLGPRGVSRKVAAFINGQKKG